MDLTSLYNKYRMDEIHKDSDKERWTRPTYRHKETQRRREEGSVVTEARSLWKSTPKEALSVLMLCASSKSSVAIFVSYISLTEKEIFVVVK